MLAIIKNEDGSTYVSPVFAYKEGRGWEGEVLIFDNALTNLIVIPMWKPYRRVFLLEFEEFQVKKANWVGYEWVVNNRKLFKNLRFGKNTSIEKFSDFKPYAKKIELPEWFEVKTEKDVEDLIESSWAFHDAYIEEYIERENDIIIKFDTTWDSHFIVKFTDIIEIDIVNRVGDIYDSRIIKNEEGFIWQITEGCEGWIGKRNFFNSIVEPYPYIKCKKIFWQIEID